MSMLDRPTGSGWTRGLRRARIAENKEQANQIEAHLKKWQETILPQITKVSIPPSLIPPESLVTELVRIGGGNLTFGGTQHVAHRSFHTSVVGHRDVLAIKKWLRGMLIRIQLEIDDASSQAIDEKRVMYMAFHECCRHVLSMSVPLGNYMLSLWHELSSRCEERLRAASQSDDSAIAEWMLRYTEEKEAHETTLLMLQLAQSKQRTTTKPPAPESERPESVCEIFSENGAGKVRKRTTIQKHKRRKSILNDDEQKAVRKSIAKIGRVSIVPPPRPQSPTSDDERYQEELFQATKEVERQKDRILELEAKEQQLLAEVKRLTRPATSECSTQTTSDTQDAAVQVPSTPPTTPKHPHRRHTKRLHAPRDVKKITESLATKLLADKSIHAKHTKWILHILHEIYMERFAIGIDECKDSMGDFVIAYFLRKYGRGPLTSDHIRTFVKSVAVHKDHHDGILLFYWFLIERLGIDDLNNGLMVMEYCNPHLGSNHDEIHAHEQETKHNVTFPEQRGGESNWVAVARAKECINHMYPKMMHDDGFKELVDGHEIGMLASWQHHQHFEEHHLAVLAETERVERHKFVKLMVQSMHADSH